LVIPLISKMGIRELLTVFTLLILYERPGSYVSDAFANGELKLSTPKHQGSGIVSIIAYLQTEKIL